MCKNVTYFSSDHFEILNLDRALLKSALGNSNSVGTDAWQLEVQILAQKWWHQRLFNLVRLSQVFICYME